MSSNNSNNAHIGHKLARVLCGPSESSRRVCAVCNCYQRVRYTTDGYVTEWSADKGVTWAHTRPACVKLAGAPMGESSVLNAGAGA